MWRTRTLWLAMLAVLYLAAAGLRVESSSRLAWLALGLGPLVLLFGWRLAAPPARGADRTEPAARSAARLVATGVALGLVAELAPPGDAFVAAQRLGVGLACVGSLLALARVTSLGGVAERKLRPRYEAAVVAGSLWAAAVAAAALIVLVPAPPVDPLTADYLAVGASLGSLALTVVAAFRLYAGRRYELGVAERAAAALWLAVLSLAVGVLAALMAVAEPEKVVPVATLVAAVSVTAASVSQQPTLISRTLRLAAAVTMLCAPLACVAVVVAYKAPTHAGLIMFVVTIGAALAGLAAPRLAHRLAPERGLWLETLAEATLAAKEPDPRQAITAVLTTIADRLGEAGGAACLYRLTSGDRASVDRARYLHIEEADFPPELVEIVSLEPHHVASTEALRHIEVRKPEVRKWVAWLDARGAGLVALVVDEEVTVGALLWPAAGRVAPLSYEEVEGARRLADHLGAVTGAAAQLARSRARELEAEHAVANAAAQVDELKGVIERQGARQRAHAEHLARPARVACYSPAAQSAALACERFGQQAESFALLAPPGVDAVCWAAIAHLTSERSAGTMLVVDATAPVEQPLEHWQDPSSSPLEVARGGTLVVLDAQALPVESQRYLGNTPLSDTLLVVVVTAEEGGHLAKGRLEEHLAARLGERLLALPALLDRAEDLRALALHHLSRIGLRLRGQPMGIRIEAQQLLNEHGWPGNDAELAAVLLRAALATDADAVDADTLAEVLGDPDLRRSGPQRRAGS